MIARSADHATFLAERRLDRNGGKMYVRGLR